MSLFLYRLGRFSYRRPMIFILVWLVAIGGVVGINLAGDGLKISSAITIDGTESQKVIDELRLGFPETAGGQGAIVFTAPEGERLDTGERATAIREAAKEITQLDVVVERDVADLKDLMAPPGKSGETEEQTAPQRESESSNSTSKTPSNAPSMLPGLDAKMQAALLAQGMLAPGVLVSEQGDVAMMQIQFTQQVEDLPTGAIDQVVQIAKDGSEPTGVTVLATETLKPHEPPLGGHEAFGLLVAGLVLILTLGSLRAAGLPLVTAAIGVGVGLGGAFALSHTIELTSATPVLALMIGLAVGIDYALFIVNRQRRLILAHGISAQEAAGRALGTAGSAVAFAGLIVVIALTGLSLIGISFLTTMALVAAVTVVFAVLIALTLLPALLGLVGEKIVGPRARAKSVDVAVENRRTFGYRFVSVVVRGKWVVITGVVLALGIAAIPMTQMTLGMPNGSTANFDTDERQAYNAISRGFGEGYNAPLLAVIQAGNSRSLTPVDVQTIAANFGQTPGVANAKVMGIAPDGNLAIVTVIPDGGPDAAGTAELVRTLRADGNSIAGIENTKIGVTGLTAVNLDISEKLLSVLPVYVAIIVVLSLIVLLVVFRSILIPLKATAGFLLSIGATFGSMTAIFQWGWLKDLVGIDTVGPILSFLPIMVTGILYGLAMDYEMFLVSSMRESHVHGVRGTDAVIEGFDQANRVVAAAAVIMVAVFAGFIFSDDPMVKQFGLALAVGILIDAFLVRMTLAPALMAVLGRWAWWLPGWLDRLIPNLDVEGANLAAHLAQESKATRNQNSL